ncbi:MAG: hypothetical protein J5979_06065 [Lachnospiraceae bacterium]|nr:hypothetical protein [Lachnospiraceae bacterium]
MRFDQNYCHWYDKNEIVERKDKIVSVKKNSAKSYQIKMKQDDGVKFHYIGRVKNGKFYVPEYHTGWKKKQGYYYCSSSFNRTPTVPVNKKVLLR